MIATGEFWLAPESDLVYLIASWGLLSLFFFYVIFFAISSSFKLFPSIPLGSNIYNKFILLSGTVILLMGISQDNMTYLTWWFYFGATLGTIEHLQST